MIRIIQIAMLLVLLTASKGFSISTIAAGEYLGVIVDLKGNVWAWGNNDYGLLGKDVIEEKTETPTQIKGLKNIIGVSAAEHVMAIDVNGALYTWGDNEYGQLGHDNSGNKAYLNIPTKVESLKEKIILDAAAGSYHSIALDSQGKIYTWGDNEFGQLGNEQASEDPVANPVAIKKFGEGSIVKVVAGSDFSMALDSEGNVYSWGNNEFGQLGHGDEEKRYTPKKIEGFGKIKIKDIAVGFDHSLALDDNNQVYTWGKDIIEVGKLILKPMIYKMPGVKKILSISAGGSTSGVIDDQGMIWTWGSTPRNNENEYQENIKPSIEDWFGTNNLAMAVSGDITLVVNDKNLLQYESVVSGKSIGENPRIPKVASPFLEWTPEKNKFYPKAFQERVLTLLLAHHVIKEKYKSITNLKLSKQTLYFIIQILAKEEYR